MAEQSTIGILDPATTAVVNIEFQNEFCHEKGKLYSGVKEVITANNCIENAVKVNAQARTLGCKIMHVGIQFKEDNTDNPTPGYGILQGCQDGALFKENQFGSQFFEAMKPQDGDIIVTGKRKLDAFPGTTLEKELTDNKIKTIILTGFLTNCCVESTMRTAYEKGFEVYTVPDCCGSTSMAAQGVSAESFNLFSKVKTVDEIMGLLGAKPPTVTERFDANTTAILNIEFVNEFCHEKGKLYGGVKGVIEKNNCINNAVSLNEKARKAGCTIMHCPIQFTADMADNPTPGYGILQGCADGALFLENTFAAEFFEPMKPQAGDIIVTGKKKLDAFPGTTLQKELDANQIKTIVLTGFLTNCCVESTMRTAYEKGYEVYTVPDCCGSTSEAAQGVAAESFGLFSKVKDMNTILQMFDVKEKVEG